MIFLPILRGNIKLNSYIHRPLLFALLQFERSLSPPLNINYPYEDAHHILARLFNILARLWLGFWG